MERKLLVFQLKAANVTVVMLAARKFPLKERQKKELDEEEWFSRKKQMEREKKTDNPSIGGVAATNRQCHYT